MWVIKVRDRYIHKTIEDLERIVIEKKVNKNGQIIFKERIETKFPLDTLIMFVPDIAPHGTMFFTIEEGSYIRFTYSWK